MDVVCVCVVSRPVVWCLEDFFFFCFELGAKIEMYPSLVFYFYFLLDGRV